MIFFVHEFELVAQGVRGSPEVFRRHLKRST